jgi:hypothetical protein
MPCMVLIYEILGLESIGSRLLVESISSDLGSSGMIRLRDSGLTTLENTLVYMVARTEIGL